MAQKGKIKKPIALPYVTVGGKYLIPRKRNVVSTINLNNGKITAEEDPETGDVYFFRNGKYMPDSVVDKYRYYDKKTKSYKKLTYWKSGEVPFTKPVVPYYDMVVNENKKGIVASGGSGFKSRVSGRIVPSKNIITLHTKGNMNLADIPENMLDSIFVSSGRAGIDPKTALGLIGKEDTFGGHSKHLGRPWIDKSGNADYFTKHHLVNNHEGFNGQPYQTYYKNLLNKHGYDEYNSDVFLNSLYPNIPDKDLIQMNNEIEWEYKHGILDKNKRKIYNPNDLLADAFMRYKENPKMYNYGQKSYQGMVERIGDEVWNEPQIQEYWNKNGQKQYLRGMKEADPNWQRDTNYDMMRAMQLGYVADEKGHYSSRDEVTGDILKYPSHPTFGMALYGELGEGYLPVKRKKGKLKANTQPTPMRQWMDNTFKQPVIPFK